MSPLQIQTAITLVGAFACILLALHFRPSPKTDAERAKRKIRTIVLIASAAVAVLLGGLMVTNMESVAKAATYRAQQPAVGIESQAQLRDNSPLGKAAQDISDGRNAYEAPAYIDAASTGKTVNLKTASGTPATVTIFSSTPGAGEWVVTYGGKKLDFGPFAEFADHVPNPYGFPQFMSLPALPTKAP